MSADPQPSPPARPAEVAERYRTIAAGLHARLAGLTDESWSAGTPCPDWAVRDLVAHVIDTHHRVLSRLDGTEPDPVDPTADLVVELRRATDAVTAALADPARAEQDVESMAGTQPFFRVVGTLLCADTLLHTWDLARATGQDERLDPAAVDAALEFLTPMDAAIRRPGAFGPKIDPPPGADPQARLITFCGRPT